MKHLFTIFCSAFITASSFAQTSVPLVQADFDGLIVPQYMGSNESSGARRLPVVFRAKVSGLVAGNTYRYYVQGSTVRDVNRPAGGAGTALIITPNGGDFLYFTTARLVADSSGILTADAQGTYSGWFAFVNSGNSRFGADSIIRPTITLNPGGSGGAAGGNVVAKRLALNQTIRCLRHSDTLGLPRGTGIYGSSLSAPKNFVVLYADEAASGRPVSVTYVESEGATVPSVVSWYNTNVNGTPGRWGAIIPNTQEGIRNITLYNQAGEVLSVATSPSTSWGTAETSNPTGGTTPLVISVTAAPLKINGLTSSHKLAIHPNPAAGNQSITITSKVACSYQLFTTDGKLVETGMSNPLGSKIRLPRGFYIVKSSNSASKLMVN